MWIIARAIELSNKESIKEENKKAIWDIYDLQIDARLGFQFMVRNDILKYTRINN